MSYYSDKIRHMDQMLDGMAYPTTKEDLIENAMENGASEDMITMLEDLPVEAFEEPSDVNTAVHFIS